MAGANAPSLSFQPQQFRVRVEITRAQALASAAPPPDLIQRASSKLASIKAEGKISFFEVYEEKLNSVWRALRTADGKTATLATSFTLAIGVPKLDGLTIISSGPTKPGVFISTSRSYDLNVISPEWIRTTVTRKAIELGIEGGLFAPQLQSAIMRLQMGELLDNFHVSGMKSIPPIPVEGKVYTLMANKSRSEIVVFVGDVEAIQTSDMLQKLCNSVAQTIDKMRANGAPEMKFCKNEMLNRIKIALKGPEKLGINRPLGVLAAIPKDLVPIEAAAHDVNATGHSSSASTATEKALPMNLFLFFQVSDDGMVANIINFESRHYANPEFVMTKEFLLAQMQAQDIKFGLDDEIFSALEDAFNKRLSLNGKVAARGKVPIPADEAYLHLVYKDAPKHSDSSEVLNVRDAQQRTVVQKGQLVGEIRFKRNPELGYTVRGVAISPPECPPLALTIGEGIQQKSPGKFYAMFDGLPKYEEGVFTISKAYVHEGDVNLKSGNLYFDGPVEIKGSIDVGATVRVRGPLKVHGSITGGTVISKEPIEVLESIVTGGQGKVICATSVKADFIENSTIECGGSLYVNRSLIGSEVIVGETVRAIAPDGFIGGGTISCRNAVIAPNIGFTKGAKTSLIVGVDRKIVRRIKIRQKRHQDLIKALERYTSESRELTSKREVQLTAKHKESKQILRDKMNQVRPLIEKAKQLVAVAKSSMTYNADALIAASNVFAANCKIEIGGHMVTMDIDTIAAAVSAKKRRETHICTYEELKNEIEKKIADAPFSENSPSNDTKKAG